MTSDQLIYIFFGILLGLFGKLLYEKWQHGRMVKLMMTACDDIKEQRKNLPDASRIKRFDEALETIWSVYREYRDEETHQEARLLEEQHPELYDKENNEETSKG